MDRVPYIHYHLKSDRRKKLCGGHLLREDIIAGNRAAWDSAGGVRDWYTQCAKCQSTLSQQNRINPQTARHV